MSRCCSSSGVCSQQAESHGFTSLGQTEPAARGSHNQAGEGGEPTLQGCSSD